MIKALGVTLVVIALLLPAFERANRVIRDEPGSERSSLLLTLLGLVLAIVGLWLILL